MTLRIDKAGRITLPKAVRERLGLQEDFEIEVVETTEGTVLNPVARQPSLIKKQGLWVHTGKQPPGFDAVRAIQDDREERLRRSTRS